MRTIYSNTKPGWYDTRQIAQAKLAQVKAGDTATGAGLVASPSTTDPQHGDTQLVTLQKILKKLQP